MQAQSNLVAIQEPQNMVLLTQPTCCNRTQLFALSLELVLLFNLLFIIGTQVFIEDDEFADSGVRFLEMLELVGLDAEVKSVIALRRRSIEFFAVQLCASIGTFYSPLLQIPYTIANLGKLIIVLFTIKPLKEILDFLEANEGLTDTNTSVEQSLAVKMAWIVTIAIVFLSALQILHSSYTLGYYLYEREKSKNIPLPSI